jgi:hypothetical protein
MDTSKIQCKSYWKGYEILLNNTSGQGAQLKPRRIVTSDLLKLETLNVDKDLE